MTHGDAGQDRDAQKLAELGYKQELSRAWSGFVWTVIAVVIFSLPPTPAAAPWDDAFDITALHHAPVVNFGLLAVVGVWWFASAKNTFTGPVRTIEFDEATGIVEVEETATEPPPRAAPIPAG
jgi:hypothetical protein